MKNSIIAVILSLITLFVISDFDFFSSLFWMPNFLWILPLYIFFKTTIFYLFTVFQGKLSVKIKIGAIVLNTLFVVILLYTGFQVWKINNGNILINKSISFQINVKNIWFWIVFQSYLLMLFFSAFKLLVTIDQEQ